MALYSFSTLSHASAVDGHFMDKFFRMVLQTLRTNVMILDLPSVTCMPITGDYPCDQLYEGYDQLESHLQRPPKVGGLFLGVDGYLQLYLLK